MRPRTYLFALGTLAALSLITSSCVESQATLGLDGVFIASGTSTEAGVFCEFDPANVDGFFRAQDIVVDIERLDQFGHFPFNISGYGPGDLVVVMGVTNRLDDNSQGSRANNNDVNVTEVHVVWKDADGRSEVYRPGRASDGGCGGDGVRQIFRAIPTEGATQTITVELVSGRISTNNGTNSELDCLRGLLKPGAPAQRLIVEVQAFGETYAGRNVESPVIKIPVFACSGCGSFDDLLKVRTADGITYESGATPMCKVE